MKENPTSFYQTGRTQPPKEHNGIFALILVAIIFLSGVVSLLGILNIHLFRQDEKASKSYDSVSFSRSNINTVSYEDDIHCPSLGIYGEFTDPLDQVLYRLPQGFYITAVETGSDAAAKGLLPGDILQLIDGIDVSQTDTPQALLENCTDGQSVRLIIYRAGSQFIQDVSVQSSH